MARTPEAHFAGAVCDGCGEVVPPKALDSNRWCPECRPRLVHRLRVTPHIIAALIVVPFAVWVWRLDKSAFLPGYAWLLPLAAAYYLGLRIGRETVKGYLRWRGTR